VHAPVAVPLKNLEPEPGGDVASLPFPVSAGKWETHATPNSTEAVHPLYGDRSLSCDAYLRLR